MRKASDECTPYPAAMSTFFMTQPSSLPQRSLYIQLTKHRPSVSDAIPADHPSRTTAVNAASSKRRASTHTMRLLGSGCRLITSSNTSNPTITQTAYPASIPQQAEAIFSAFSCLQYQQQNASIPSEHIRSVGVATPIQRATDPVTAVPKSLSHIA
ncbi:hypothetical protein K458DRAFT_401548 [Lentithecium fluviatile CBS 122367]|uniref:Uncharacterized protein n=1 Tax=Lentithecium fluviatile CBS 122367 TaxID=1168545 RepID=A0A6G1JCA9_9PLEO|nr:hypothetical protein K458DRAFT_401548 [Lentithecium fluviatile CBS 122367]